MGQSFLKLFLLFFLTLAILVIKNPATVYGLDSIPAWVKASDGVYTDKVIISWPAVAGASVYKIYRDGLKCAYTYPPNTSIGDYGDWNLPIATYNDCRGLITGKVYTYRVTVDWSEQPTDTQGTTDTGYTTINKPPVITTIYLYQATYKRSYTGFIRGSDPNPTDTLVITAQNLPPGISMQPCLNYPAGNISYIACRIEGAPTKVGIYNVLITMRDSLGVTVTKTLPLKVVY